MTANKVYEALNSYIGNNVGPDQIDLWAAANGSPDLDGMKPLLGIFGIASSYVWSAAALSLSPDGLSVTLRGNGSFTCPNISQAGSTSSVKGVLVFKEGDQHFNMRLTVVGGWKFGAFFGSLPKTLMGGTDQQGLTWQNSILTEMQVDGASFYAQDDDLSLTMTGALLELDNAYFRTKTRVIQPYPLQLNGTLELPTAERDFPILSVDASGNKTTLTGDQGLESGPGTLSLNNPGLTLIIDKLVEPILTNKAFSTVRLFGDFSVGLIHGRVTTLILSTQKVWRFNVYFEDGTFTLRQGLVEMTNLFRVPLPIPMNFPLLNDFFVSEFDFSFEEKESSGLLPSFDLISFAVTIRSIKEWNPPLPFVTISDIGTRWIWSATNVIDERGATKKSYLLSGSVFGTWNFGNKDGDSASTSPDDNQPAGGSGGTIKEVEVDDKTRIRTVLSLPDFYLSGQLVEGSIIPIGKALEVFFGGDILPDGLKESHIPRFEFSADPINQTYFAGGKLVFGEPGNEKKVQGWELNLIVIIILLEEVEFDVRVSNGAVSGGVTAVLYLGVPEKLPDPNNLPDPGDLPPAYTMPRLIISAQYPQQEAGAEQGWILGGKIYPGTKVNLTELVAQYILGKHSTQDVPSWVPTIMIDQLEAEFTTGSANVQPSYKFKGAASARWNPKIFGDDYVINAAASVDMKKGSRDANASGTITGEFSVNKIAVSAALTFGVPEATYMFKVQFDQIWLKATTSWRGETGNRHQVISLQLGGVTLGDMLEYLVNLAAPTLGYQLDSPWDILKKVELDRFVFTVDPTENSVEFVFNANVDLVVAKLDSIGVRYTNNSGKSKVNLILTGNFLGEKYTSDKPLAWDVVNDPPPAVPGQGKSLLDLRYLGLGQRVTYKGPSPDTVKASVDMLKSFMTPYSGQGSPVPNQMQYSSESQWLIGLDVTLIETLDLAFIFNDPKLYGLSIGLKGERAGALAGLKFEILYKKIMDDIGMYRIEFQVPDMFRTINLGAVALTLGIIVIEIYTNGNFKVDLGFPYNRNFDRSFSLQASIFIGRGGFYLGVLNGQTSTKVPKITNGNFSPVIELGIGIAAGVGREFRAGIISGGAYIQLEVIFEGVMAFFNPNSSGVAPANFFKCTGIMALYGKVYGSVDFKVIKVSVTLEAYAQVRIIYESYQPMYIDMQVGVRAEASIKILFIRIKFSFSVTLSFSFTIGKAQPTPWVLASAGGSTGVSSRSLLAARGAMPATAGMRASGMVRNRNARLTAMRKSTATQSALKQRVRGAEENFLSTNYTLNWDPERKVFADSPRPAHLTMLPVFSLTQIPVDWSGQLPQNPTPSYRSAFVLLADTGMSVESDRIDALKERSAKLSAMTATDDDTSLLAADCITEALLRYTINAYPREAIQENTISAGQIESLLEQLNLPESSAIGFSIENLATFFETNIHFWISGDPNAKPAQGEAPLDPKKPEDKSAMVFPMPPFVSWESTPGGAVDFSDKNKVGAWYEWGINQFLNAYYPVGETNPIRPADDPNFYESFASFMFRDFCLMLVKNGVTEMQKHLNSATVKVGMNDTVVQSLSDIARTFDPAFVNYTLCVEDTLNSVASALGATPEELEFLNPGIENEITDNPAGYELKNIKLGIAPLNLGTDNSQTIFGVKSCALGTLVHQAELDENLSAIATLFSVQVADMLKFPQLITPEFEFPVLRSFAGILKAGAKFDLNGRVYTAPDAEQSQQVRTAAIFFARYTPTLTIQRSPIGERAEWYVQAISSLSLNTDTLNLILPKGNLLPDVELLPGYTLYVPSKYQNDYATSDKSRNKYVTVSGDTLMRIGEALALSQDFPTSNPEGLDQWQNFLAQTTSAGDLNWNIPAQTGIEVESGDVIETVVRRMIIEATWVAIDRPNGIGEWTYNWDQAAGWLGVANIIQPLATITVPDAQTGTHDDLSFDLIANVYGLPVNEAATRLSDIPGLYALDTILNVSLLAAKDIDTLVQEVLEGESFAAIVNQASRMLMAGLILPGLKEDGGHVVPDEENTLPLYDLTGQQFDLKVDPKEPTELALELTATSAVNWIEMMDSIVVQEGDTLEGLQTTYPQLLTYNPGLNEQSFKVGMVLLTQPEPNNVLPFAYTNEMVLNESPADALSVVPGPGYGPQPNVLPVSGTVPVTYGLDKRIDLQTPVKMPIPQNPGQENISGNPSLWMFPSSLQSKASSPLQTPYEILVTKSDSPTGDQAEVLLNSTYGAVLPFKVKRMETSASRFNLLGVDTDDRDQLLEMIAWLGADEERESSKVYLMIAPAPNANNTSGYIVLTPDEEDTYIIKSNLSTESAPPASSNNARALRRSSTESAYFATLGELKKFLLLLWEGSVVGGTGYYFGIGQNIPQSAFDEQGNITFQFLMIATTQQEPAPNGRSLLPFNNCALMSAGLDSSYQSLFMESADDDAVGETIVQAILPPGNFGFNFLSKNPNHLVVTFTDAERAAQQMFSLLSFYVEKVTGSPFAAVPSGLPVSPAPSDGELRERWKKQRQARRSKALGESLPDEEALYNYYEQVFPVSRFVTEDTAEAAPQVDGLPDPGKDPYLGYGTQATIPFAHFMFGFGDVLGNRTGANGEGQGALEIPAGYTDPLIGINEWPSIGRYFEVQGEANKARLIATIFQRPSELLPTPSEPGDVNFDVVRQQRDKYSQIYFQLIQPRIEAWLVTSLKYIPDAAYGNKGVQIADMSATWKFAAGAYVNAGSLLTAVPEGGVRQTSIDGILSDYHVRTSELAQANSGRTLEELFGDFVPVVPGYVPFVENQSVENLYDKLPNSYTKPSSAEAMLLQDQNMELLLREGTFLERPAAIVITPEAGETLSAMATRAFTSVQRIANENALVDNLNSNVEFAIEVSGGMEIVVTTTAANRSFDWVLSQFTKEGVYTTVDELAVQKQDDPTLYAADALLNVLDYQVQPKDTFAANQSGQDAQALASKNVRTNNVFDPGALVYVSPFDISADGLGDLTLEEFASRYACPMELILDENSAQDLGPMTMWSVPGTLRWVESQAFARTAYTTGADDTLNVVAPRFQLPAEVTNASVYLATANADMPGVILPNIALTIQVGGSPIEVNTGANPTYASVLASVRAQNTQATMQDVTDSTGNQAIWLSGGLLVCGLGLLSAAASPEEIETNYNVPISAWALANTAMLGLILPDQTLYSLDGKISVPTYANDTFNALIVRFAEKKVSMDAGQIASNPHNRGTQFLAASGKFLLPPAEIHFETDLDSGGPYEKPIFPLDVQLRFQRPEDLIYPDFKTAEHTGMVEMVQSAIPAPTNSDAEETGLNYNDFIVALETALPDLRLATGQVSGVTQDLWCVNFNAQGIREVSLKGAITVPNELKKQPRFFALKPLYNHLVSRPAIPIKILKDDGTLGDPSDIAFQSIDTELWARTFLADVDKFLSGPYAAAAFGNESMQSSLNTVIDSKKTLQTQISLDLANLLVVQDNDATAALQSAKTSLEQQLGISLSRTYEAAVLIQYDSDADTAWQDPGSKLLPANLYGDGKIMTENQAEVTLISAKIDLAKEKSYVNFLLSEDNPAVFFDAEGGSSKRHVLGDFRYGISHIEFDIHKDQRVSSTYNASDWLTFMPVLAKTDKVNTKPQALIGTDPGTVDAPLPLRLFPDNPVIVGQSASYYDYDPKTDDISVLGLWKYGYTYSHQHEEQDFVKIVTGFNLKEPNQKMLREVKKPELFPNLAQYISVANALWNDLSALTDPASSVPEQTRINAVATFADLVKSVSDSWSTRLDLFQANTRTEDNFVASMEFELNARVEYQAEARILATYTLRSNAVPSPTGKWPSVQFIDAEGKKVPLELVSQTSTMAVYKPKDELTTPVTWPTFELTWEELPVSSIQNARSEMLVVRNQDLVDKVETNPLFIFSTNRVVAPGVVTPLIEYGRRIEINGYGTNLGDALNNCFNDILQGSAVGQVVTIEMSYGFELVKVDDLDLDGLVTYLPIGLYPSQTLTTTTGQDLAAIIEEWYKINQPTTDGGEWVFSLRLYSQQTLQPLTLLYVKRLYYSMDA